MCVINFAINIISISNTNDKIKLLRMNPFVAVGMVYREIIITLMFILSNEKINSVNKNVIRSSKFIIARNIYQI